MCGLAGALIGEKPGRTNREFRIIERMFTRILTLSERRGPYATGVALVNRRGHYYVSKAPIPASRFVSSRSYRTVLSNLNNNTTLLMGHTRWPTRGSHLNNENNHPLVGDNHSGTCILTHNGHISNSGMLFRAMGLSCRTQVDSEILLRISEKNLTKDGIDPDGLAADLAYCRGRMSFVVTSANCPTEVIIVKGNQPLELRYSERHHVLLYASEAEFLDEALSDEDDWVEWRMSPMSLLVFHSQCLMNYLEEPFEIGSGNTWSALKV